MEGSLKNPIFRGVHEKPVWVNIFYQVLYGNFWKYEMLDGEIVNISRIINGWNMKFFKYLWNRKSCKA